MTTRHTEDAVKLRPVACQKCGSDDIYRAYHPVSTCTSCGECHQTVGSSYEGYSCKGGRDEHLRDVCRGCGFVRYSKPLDRMGTYRLTKSPGGPTE